MMNIKPFSFLSLWKRMVLCVMATCIILTSGFTYSQLSYWRDPTAFHRPVKVYRAWTNNFSQQVIPANCSLLFEGDKNEIKKVQRANEEWKGVPDSYLYNKVKNDCFWITEEFEENFYTSEQELNFPLAFALNVYNSPQQIVRFLKVIYRPHNVYCLHYDQKSEQQFKQLITNIANCLPNVIVASKIENVIWGWHTIVDAQMNCLKDLYEIHNVFHWKYVITLCGKEVPLRTNREMVQTLSKLNGTSAIKASGSTIKSKKEKEKHSIFKHDVKNGLVFNTREKLGPVPFNLTVQKSMSYMGLSEAFVDFLLHDEIAIEFRKFMDQTYIPDEHFISTLYRIPGVPGGFDDNYYPMVPIIDSYRWLHQDDWESVCNGWKVHHICIISSGDLHRLQYRPHLESSKRRDVFFHNKFFMEKDRTVIDCLMMELGQRNKLEYLRDQL